MLTFGLRYGRGWVSHVLDRALALAPNHPILLWARTRLMPAIPESESEEQADIHAYDAGLHSLHDATHLA